MARHQNKLSQFWQELKRRRVIHVITVYASAAFVVIELIGNLTEPLNLPASLSTIVIIILAVGFPFALIISWIYDLTGEGFRKTLPFKEFHEGKESKVPGAWKIATYTSFVVIIGLVVLNLAARNNLVKPGSIQSLVILPFENYTGNEGLEYFVSGMHSSLIGDMGRIGGLRIISTSSSNVYQNVNKSVPEIAAELNVDAVIEPAVMCLGDTICLQIKVFSAYPEEKLIWVEDYKEEKSQILNLYNRITRQIANEVRIGLTPDEDRILSEDRTVNPLAFDAFLRGQYYWENLDPDSIPKAVEYFELAIERDPGWADPYAGLAQAWSQLGRFGLTQSSLALQRKYQYLNKALELDPNSAHAHYVKANNAVWTEWNWELAEEEYLKTLKLNPNHVLARLYYSHLLMILRRTEEAVKEANLGLELDPLKPIILGLHSIVMTDAGDYESAINSLDKALSIYPEYNFAIANRPLPYFLNKDYDKWIESWKQKVNWSDEAKSLVLQEFNKKGPISAIEKMFELNEKYVPEDCNMNDGTKAIRYLHLGNYEKAIDNLEAFYEKGPIITVNTKYISPNLYATYIGTNLYGYDRLKNHPRYIALLKKMKLPLPESN